MNKYINIQGEKGSGIYIANGIYHLLMFGIFLQPFGVKWINVKELAEIIY